MAAKKNLKESRGRKWSEVELKVPEPYPVLRPYPAKAAFSIDFSSLKTFVFPYLAFLGDFE